MGNGIENQPEEKKKPQDAFRLSDMVVESVDLVDRAANKRRFILFKREAGMSKQDGVQITESHEGEVISVVPDPESGTTGAVAKGEEKPEEKAKPKKVCEVCGKDPCICDKAKTEEEKAKTKKVCEVCGKEPCICAKGKEKPEATTEEKAAAIVCPKCGTEGKGKAGDKCPKCGADMAVKSADAEKKPEEEDKACKKPKKEEPQKKDLPNEAKKTADAEAKVKEDEKAKAKEDEEKKKAATDKAIPGPVATALNAAFREATERLMSVATALRQATVTQDQSSTPLPAKVSSEIEAIKTLLGSVVQRYPSPASKCETSDAELLKQALSLPGPVRDAVLEKVRMAIEKLLSVMRAVKEIPTDDTKTNTPMPPEIGNAVKAVVADLEAICSKYPSPASKSVDVLAALQKNFDEIKEVVGGLLAGTTVNQTVSKADSDKVAGLEKRVADLTAELAVLKEKKLTIPPGNSNPDEGTGVKKNEGRFKWPADLAESVKNKK